MSEDNNYTQKENYSKKSHRERHSVFFPLMLVAVGAYMLYSNFGNSQGSSFESLLQLWPLILIISGLDGLILGNGFVSSVIFIGIWTFFLLSNFGYLTSQSLWSILRFWPVLLIAWGLDLIVGQRSIWSAIFGVLIGIILLGGIAWLAVNPNDYQIDSVIESHTIKQSLKGATSANVEISRLTGLIDVSKKSESAYLVQGELHLNNGESYDESLTQGKKRAYYNLSHDYHQIPFIPMLHPSRTWELQFNPMIPLDLDIELAVGEMRLDLRKLKVESLSSNLAVGKMVLTLPDGSYQGNVDLPVGEIIIFVPEDSKVRIRANTAMTAVHLPDSYEKYEDIITSDSSVFKTGNTDIDLSVDLPMGNLLIQTY